MRKKNMIGDRFWIEISTNQGQILSHPVGETISLTCRSLRVGPYFVLCIIEVCTILSNIRYELSLDIYPHVHISKTLSLCVVFWTGKNCKAFNIRKASVSDFKRARKITLCSHYFRLFLFLFTNAPRSSDFCPVFVQVTKRINLALERAEDERPNK